jgi:hypothetical protein
MPQEVRGEVMETVYRIEPSMALPGWWALWRLADNDPERNEDQLLGRYETIRAAILMLPPEHRVAPEDEGGNHDHI